MTPAYSIRLVERIGVIAVIGMWRAVDRALHGAGWPSAATAGLVALVAIPVAALLAGLRPGGSRASHSATLLLGTTVFLALLFGVLAALGGGLAEALIDSRASTAVAPWVARTAWHAACGALFAVATCLPQYILARRATGSARDSG